MRKTLLAWSIPVMLPVPLVGHAQVQPTDPNLLQMKLEEANFLLDQRRQQLEHGQGRVDEPRRRSGQGHALGASRDRGGGRRRRLSGAHAHRLGAQRGKGARDGLDMEEVQLMWTIRFAAQEHG